MGQALQGHVLEGARRPVPQLQDVGALVQRGNGADGLIIEIVAIGAAHELVDGLVGQIDVERLVDGGRPLGVGETRQSADLVKAQRRQLFGNVETAALGQAVDDGLGERHRLAGCSTRVHVQVLAERGGRSMRCAMNHPSSKRSDRIKDTTSPALWRGVSDGLCEFRAHGTKYEKVNF